MARAKKQPAPDAAHNGEQLTHWRRGFKGKLDQLAPISHACIRQDASYLDLDRVERYVPVFGYIAVLPAVRYTLTDSGFGLAWAAR